ncbi:MAG: hypothetical protein ACXV5I_04385 [Halobacteriota archaeon]
MKKIAFVVVGMLALLLFSNAAVLAAGAPDNEQKVVIPNEWHGKNKIIIPHGDLVQVVYIKRTDDAVVSTNDPTLVYGDPWTGTDPPPDPSYQNGYDVAAWHWVLSKSENQKGVKYIVNPSVAVAKYKLTQTSVVNAIQDSFNAWNKVGPKPTKSSSLYAYGGVSLTARHSNSIDHKNVVSWASVLDSSGNPDPNIVAVSYMWYRISDGGLLDCDTVFNTYFTWGINSGGSTFDIQDIGTHEFGHWTGLNDIYDSTCTPMTMYGYAWYGEVYKRTLEQGDAAGVHAAYAM